MKKLILLLSIAGMALSSCQGKYTIAKRKYNKGFYISVNKGKNANPETLVKSNKKAEITKAEIVEQEIVSITQIKTTTPENLLVKSFAEPTAIAKKTTYNAPNVVASTNTKPIIEKTELQSINTYKKVTSNKSSSGGDTNIIVLVILALFPILCLIAVYLHDGKKITLNFWIDLLLHITVIGEIIFALLVVLDVINLA